MAIRRRFFSFWKRSEKGKKPGNGFLPGGDFQQEKCDEKGVVLLFQEFDKLIAVGSDGGEISFDDEFRNRINVCLENYRPGKIASAPYFMTA